MLSVSEEDKDVVKQPIRIYLNYDAVGHSFDRDCQTVGDVVKVVAFTSVLQIVTQTNLFVCFIKLSWVSLLLRPLSLLAILISNLQCPVIAGIIALLMTFLGRTKGVAYARFCIILDIVVTGHAYCTDYFYKNLPGFRADSRLVQKSISC